MLMHRLTVKKNISPTCLGKFFVNAKIFVKIYCFFCEANNFIHLDEYASILSAPQEQANILHLQWCGIK